MASFVFFLCLAVALSSAAGEAQISVWPKPTSVSWPIPISAPLSPTFSIHSPHPHLRPLRIACRRYTDLLLSERHRPLTTPGISISPSASPIRLLSLSISSPHAPLTHGADESYTLYIPSTGGIANLTAETPWGAIRGMETMSQMATSAGEADDVVLLPAGVYVFDRPLFAHRGLLLDTGRTFFHVKDLLRTVRAMGHNKMNVFHWHITDSQSFPLILPSEPRLATEGSYGHGMMYSPKDVRRVVHYALSHGVRVIPEIDAPGHAGSWAGAYHDIVTCAGKFWLPPAGAAMAAEPGTGQLNPLKPETYAVVRNVLRDAVALFPDQFIHAGADEVFPSCWNDDPTIQAFLSGNGTAKQLLETFINTTHPYIVSLNRTAIYWEDVILSSTVKIDPTILPPETTVMQTWNNGPNNTKTLTSAGYRVIVSSADFYYLDCGHGGWVGNDSRYDRQAGDGGQAFNYAGGNGGSWCSPFKSWQRVYDYDITYGLTDEEAGLVLGGEVALWSEQADSTVLDARIWPRAAAAAEALWSGNRGEDGRKRYAEATDRLNEWRHRMVRRSIGAEPIQPLWCVMNPEISTKGAFVWNKYWMLNAESCFKWSEFIQRLHLTANAESIERRYLTAGFNYN